MFTHIYNNKLFILKFYIIKKQTEKLLKIIYKKILKINFEYILFYIEDINLAYPFNITCNNNLVVTGHGR